MATSKRLLSLAVLLCHVATTSHAFPLPFPASTLASSKSRLYLDGQGMAGGFFNKHLLGDVIRALQPESLAQTLGAVQGNIKGARVINLENMVDNAPSWEELAVLLKKEQSEEEGNFRTALEQGKVHSPLANMRLFGTDTEPRVLVYRDSAAWCPYCQKLWIVLEELQISYEIKRVDMNCYSGGSKPPDFLQLQPSGNLPCAVFQGIDGHEKQIVLGESNTIIDMLNDMHTATTGKNLLRPEDQEERIQYLCDDGKYNSLERKLFSEWMWYLTGKRKPLEYKQRYTAQLNAVEEALSSKNTEGPYFLGKELSLPDILFVPFVERQAASLAYFKGFIVRDEARWPNLVKWLQAMESRPSYQVTKSDYYTHSRALPPQLSAETPPFTKGECEPMRDAIDALSLPTNNQEGLPTQDSLDWTEPGWDWSGASPSKNKREASERLLVNHERIVRFAARGAGTPGFPAAAAPLADPRSVANEEATPAVDVLLRHVVHSLIVDESNSATAIENFVASLWSSDNGQESIESLVDCLDYLRMRIGVPRDMSYPAAREMKINLLNLAKLLMNSTTAAAALVVNEEDISVESMV